MFGLRLDFSYFFGFSSDSGFIFFYFFLFFARFWMVNESIFLGIFTLRPTAFDVAKPALPHPVRPRRARTSRWFSPATAGRRVDCFELSTAMAGRQTAL
jgi:hypothetical protein